MVAYDIHSVVGRKALLPARRRKLEIPTPAEVDQRFRARWNSAAVREALTSASVDAVWTLLSHTAEAAPGDQQVVCGQEEPGVVRCPVFLRRPQHRRLLELQRSPEKDDLMRVIHRNFIDMRQRALALAYAQGCVR